MDVMIPLTVKIIIDKKSRDASYVAYTPELDVASCGPTEKKARHNLQAAVRIFMEEVRKRMSFRSANWRRGIFQAWIR